jgi:AhpD family alkylhydroperoxidase
MRLEVLEHGQKRPARLLMGLVQLATRHSMDNVAMTAMYRPDFWGGPFFEMGSEVLRGPSYWSAGEREYMAMRVSRLNECPFCERIHTQTTRLELGAEADAAIRPELAAVVPFVEKVTTAPDAVTADDVAPVRAAGVPDDAIVDALHIALIFNTVNRMANALGWSWDSDRHVRLAAQAIHRINYKLPGFVMR